MKIQCLEFGYHTGKNPLLFERYLVGSQSQVRTTLIQEQYLLIDALMIVKQRNNVSTNCLFKCAVYKHNLASIREDKVQQCPSSGHK